VDETRLTQLIATRTPREQGSRNLSAGLPGDLSGEWDPAECRDPATLYALIEDPSTSTATLKRLAGTPRIGVRRALLDSPRCPLVSSVAEDRLAFEGVDVGLFVDESSRRTICRALIGTAHRAETDLLFSDPTFRILDCLRTVHSLFTVHGGKKRDRKLNRHDYLRFLAAFNARGGQQEVLDLPFITLLTAIRILGQERLVIAMTTGDGARAGRTLRLLEAVAGNQAGEEGIHQQALIQRWIARHEDWAERFHDYLDRKFRRRSQKRRNRTPQPLFQARYARAVRELNREGVGTGVRIHLPRTEHELRTLGATMANCVGSDHNIDGAVDGRHLILHAHPPGARRKGATCQFDRHGRLLQARGFANAEADEKMVARASEVVETLRSGDAAAAS